MGGPVIERAVPVGAALGECPVWSVAEACLYWVDIEGRSVHRYDPATGHDESRSTPGRPGAVMLTTGSGRLLLAIEHRLAWVDWPSGTVDTWVDLEPPDTTNRLNDGRCDPVGRVWVGSIFADISAEVCSGRLYRVDPDGTSTVARSDIGVANGLAFAPDGHTMYFADSPARTVWAYDYDLDTGRPTRERIFFAFGDLPGKPDGACVDIDGGYWLACVYGGAVVRITPDGRVDRRIELPVSRPSRCTFGGADLDVLYITSIGVDAVAHGDDPTLAGDVFAVTPGVTGLPEPVVAT